MTHAKTLILCATRRLARSLQQAAASGDGRAAEAATITGWLDQVFEAALLRGELPAAEAALRVLSPLQERLVWRQVIGRALGKEAAAALFDLDGLARAAQDAHALMTEWGLSAAAVQLGTAWSRRTPVLRLIISRAEVASTPTAMPAPGPKRKRSRPSRAHSVRVRNAS